MALESPFVRKLRSDEEVDNDTAGATPAPQGGASSYADQVRNSPGMRLLRGIRDAAATSRTRYSAATGLGETPKPTLAGPPVAAAPAAAPTAAAAPRPAPARQAAAAAPTLARPVPAPAQGAVTTLDPAARVVGTFNGRTITQADADALAQKLPTASGPVVMGPNGSYAAATTGGAPGRVATTAPNAAVNAERVQAPTLVMPRSLSGDLEGAEKERQQRLGDIDSAMFGLRGRLNSRGRRDLYATLLGQQNQLTRDRVNQVTGLETEGARLANAGAIEQARLGTQVGEGNANRALEADRVNSGATLRREELADARNQPNRTLRDTQGATTLLRNDGSLSPLTGADGKPFREAATDSGAITDSTLFEAYRKDIAAINENTLLKPEERASMLQEIEARPEYQSVLSKLRGNAGGAKPSLEQFLETARAANPGVSDQDLTNYYNREYGG